MRLGDGLRWFLFLLIGCSQMVMAAQDAPLPDWQRALLQQGTQGSRLELFRIAGSNTIGAHLAPNLVAGFFRAEGLRDVTVETVAENNVQVTGTLMAGERPLQLVVPVLAHGTRTGFQALAQGSALLAAASRRIRPEEAQPLGSLAQLQSADHELVVAIDGLAIIVHPSNPLRQLDLRQIRNLFTGRVRNWAEVGGAPGPVNLLARDEKSGTRDTFDALVLQDQPLATGARRFESNERLAEAVQADVSAIGFVPLAHIGQARALAVADGSSVALAPTALTVATEDYPLSRRLYFYRVDAGQRAPALAALLRYVHSDAGQRVATETGFVAQSLHPVVVETADTRLDGWSRLNMNIRFEEGSSELDDKARQDVQRLTDFLNQSAGAGLVVTLVGYSPADDARGLSRLRAQNVRWQLRQQGVDGRVATLAGDATLVAGLDSVQTERNRRVEIWVRIPAGEEAGSHRADMAERHP